MLDLFGVQRENKLAFNQLNPLSPDDLQCAVFDGLNGIVNRRNQVFSLEDKAWLHVVTKEDSFNPS